jgi:NADP-dependent 3-hydroxy acid dehydrogenase YdfG
MTIAASGTTVTLMARHSASLEAAATPLRASGSKVDTIVCDVLDAGALDQAVAEAVAGLLD